MAAEGGKGEMRARAWRGPGSARTAALHVAEYTRTNHSRLCTRYGSTCTVHVLVIRYRLVVATCELRVESVDSDRVKPYATVKRRIPKWCVA